MNVFASDITVETVLKSQFDILNWQLFPGLVLVFFITIGLHQMFKQYSNRRKMGIKGVQRTERKNISLPLIINTPVTQEFSVNTFDISLTGAFLSYEDLQHSMSFTSLIGKRSGIKVGDLVDVKILIGRFSSLSCQARVIRYNFSDNQMPPKGIGIEFVNLSSRKKKALATLIYSEASNVQTA